MKRWEDTSQHNYQSIGVDGIAEVPNTILPVTSYPNSFYGSDEKMVFFVYNLLRDAMGLYKF